MRQVRETHLYGAWHWRLGLTPSPGTRKCRDGRTARSVQGRLLQGRASSPAAPQPLDHTLAGAAQGAPPGQPLRAWEE